MNRWKYLIYLIFIGLLIVVWFNTTPFLVNPCRFQIVDSPQTIMTPEINAIEKRLRENVKVLAEDIGERNVFNPEQLHRTADFIQKTWQEQGYEVQTQVYEVDGIPSENLWVEIKGSEQPGEIILVGAHYDTVLGSPGANDNGSGVAALLELSRAFKKMPQPKRTVRFAAFVNEEPPFFLTRQMGSRVYAEEAKKKKEKISAMVCLETIGYYTNQPKSQNLPPFLGAFYPHTGNFVAVVGNVSSRKLVNQFAGFFKESIDVPCECLAAPSVVPGVDWSDHSSFWKYGYSAIMITDTAPYRYPYYHRSADRPDKLNYPVFAKVVYGLIQSVQRLTN